MIAILAEDGRNSRSSHFWDAEVFFSFHGDWEPVTIYLGFQKRMSMPGQVIHMYL